MSSHLTGRARAWATAEWSRGSPICQSMKALRRVFDPTTSGRETARKLNSIRQGMNSVSDYAIRFRTLAIDSGWNTTALYDAFLKGLSDPIQDLLVPLDLPEDLDSLIALAVRIDHRLKERKRDRSRATVSSGPHQRSSFACSTWMEGFPPFVIASPKESSDLQRLGGAHAARKGQVVCRGVTPTPTGREVFLLWTTGTSAASMPS